MKNEYIKEYLFCKHFLCYETSICFLLLLFCASAIAQSENPISQFNKLYKDSLTIQHIDLRSNQVLFTEVNKYIKQKSDSSALFRTGFGYVTIGGIQLNSLPTFDATDSFPLFKKDIAISFTIGLSSSVLVADKHSTSFGSNSFPIYYSFINNRLVLIYDADLKWVNGNNYTMDSKKRIIEIVEKTLLQVFDPNFVFSDFRRNNYTLSSTERLKLSRLRILQNAAFTLNESKVFFLYTDGSVSYQYHN